ncbi:MAG: nuclear transport factor 2 family protein [Trueperaceae bacterium]
MKRLMINTLVLLSLIFSAAFAQSTTAPSTTDELLARVQQLEDLQAIEETQYCYGRAQDVVYRNYADLDKARSDGMKAFLKCFDKDADITISLHGSQVLNEAPDVAGWIEFVVNFGQTNKYLSTRHLIGNVEVEITGPDTAIAYSAGSTPHFVMGSDTEEQPVVDWIIGNYYSELERINGEWKITKFLLDADEYARTPGFYPLGQSDGLGNIGFEDNY